MNMDKPKIKQHPNWEPYEYKLKEYSLSEEEESQQGYSTYRKTMIDKERQAVDLILKQQQKEFGGGEEENKSDQYYENAEP